MAPSSASKEKKAPVSKGKKPQAAAEDSSAFGPIAERFRRAGDLDRAVSLCREGLQKFPDRLSARVTLGWALLELGKYDEAQAELEQVLRQRPDNLAAIRALAELHDRAEQTLNLPMDGPGQWPPSADAVDEAGSMVAGSFLALSGEDADEFVNAAGAAIHSTPQPAVVPPAELGLAMWSALPATEPEPEPIQEYPGRTLFVGDAIAAAAIGIDDFEAEPQVEANAELQVEAYAEPQVEAHAEPQVAAYAEPQVAAQVEVHVAARAEQRAEQQVDAHASGVSDADLAALLAEADSLDALADNEPAPAVAFQAMADAVDAQASLETAQDFEPALVLDEAQDLPALDELTWGMPDVPVQAEVPQPEMHAAEFRGAEFQAVASMADVQVASMPDVQVASMPDVQAASMPDVEIDAEPGFQLESLSIGAVEAMPLEAALAVEPEAFVVDPELQPILRFDLEPVVEIAPEPIAAAVVAPEPIALPESVALPEPAIAAVALPEDEEMVASAVIAQTHARIAAVVSMARVKEQEQEAASSRSQLQALEHFLACVHARRRRVLTESVA